MNIILIERLVERCENPTSPNYLKVENMSSKVVDTYVSDVVPRKGEIIFIDDDKIYDVVEVIYQKHGINRTKNPVYSVHIEVKPHISVHTYETYNLSFKEDWPVVISLPFDFLSCDDYPSDHP